jgi:hypothetical protein
MRTNRHETKVFRQAKAKSRSQKYVKQTLEIETHAKKPNGNEISSFFLKISIGIPFSAGFCWTCEVGGGTAFRLKFVMSGIGMLGAWL